MTKPVYSIDAPDVQRLKAARLEIEAVLRKYDIAGVVQLHTPGMGEFFYDIRPSYSVCWIDEGASAVRIKSKKDRDHGGDADLQRHDQAATANMVASLADNLYHSARMFLEVRKVVDHGLRAEHVGPTFVADPHQAKPH
jgi:hypothetical protein